MRMGRATVATFVTSLLVAGCATDPGDAGNIPVDQGPVPAHPAPVDGPAVTGRAFDTAGQPAAGATVLAWIDLNGGERLGRNWMSFTSFGLACLTDVECTVPTEFGRVAADGRFALEAPQGEVDRRDDLVVMVVAARGDEARVATTVRVDRHRNGSGDAGTVTLAAGSPQVRRSDHTIRLEMPSVGSPTSGTRVRMARAQLVDGQYVEDGTATPVSGGLDSRVIEDGQVLLTGVQEGRVRDRRAAFSATIVTSGATVPPTRGEGCYVLGSRGQRIKQQPCGLTDGILDEQWRPRDDPRCKRGPCKGRAQHDHRDSTVVFDRPLDVGLVVVRGCGFTCRVGLSTDGRTFGYWREAGTSSPDDVFIDKIQVRHVVAIRVETATGGFFSSLREVSAFS
jgi:hypothetical protein